MTRPLNNAENYFPLVQIQPKHNNLAPIICVPGAGGSVVNFLSLVNALKTDRSIYGIQPRGLDGTHVPHDSVSSATECYLRALDAAGKYKAFHLLGHSFGGWIVFEMAEKLLAMGRKVESLVIIDSDVPDEADAAPRYFDEIEVLLQFIGIIEQMVDRSIQISEIELRTSSESKRRDLIHRRMVQFGLLPSRSDSTVLIGPIRTFAACLPILYTPTHVYPHLAHLVLMSDPRLSNELNEKKLLQRVGGWQRWAPNLIFWNSPGNHMSAFQHPHVNAVANWLQETVYF
jgi:thioesterase domain-containing protein